MTPFDLDELLLLGRALVALVEAEHMLDGRHGAETEDDPLVLSLRATRALLDRPFMHRASPLARQAVTARLRAEADAVRGLGRIALPPVSVAECAALLRLAGAEVGEKQVAAWTPDQRERAAEWAGAAQLAAGDNDAVGIPPRPDFIPRRKSGRPPREAGA